MSDCTRTAKSGASRCAGTQPHTSPTKSEPGRPSGPPASDGTSPPDTSTNTTPPTATTTESRPAPAPVSTTAPASPGKQSPDSTRHSTKDAGSTGLDDRPPSSQGAEAEQWAEAIASWSTEEGHTAPRVLSLQSKEKISWAEEQLRISQRDEARFGMKAIRGEAGIPAINFAMFEQRAVFIVLTTKDAMGFPGIGIESEEVAEYFDLLWYRATPLEEALAELALETGSADANPYVGATDESRSGVSADHSVT